MIRVCQLGLYQVKPLPVALMRIEPRLALLNGAGKQRQSHHKIAKTSGETDKEAAWDCRSSLAAGCL